MRIWIYGDNSEQIQDIMEENVNSGDTVVGTSVRAEIGAAFPQSSLTPAVSAAIRREFDLLLIPAFGLLGDKTKADQMISLFQGYGVSVRSVSSNGINSS